MCFWSTGLLVYWAVGLLGCGYLGVTPSEVVNVHHGLGVKVDDHELAALPCRCPGSFVQDKQDCGL